MKMGNLVTTLIFCIKNQRKLVLNTPNLQIFPKSEPGHIRFVSLFSTLLKFMIRVRNVVEEAK